MRPFRIVRNKSLHLAVLIGLWLLAIPWIGIAAATEIKTPEAVIIEQVVAKPFNAVTRRVEAAIKGARMIIIGEPNYQLMQRMVGRERRAAKAYFIFRQDFGTPIFENDYNAALEVPLKLLMYERDDKKTVLRYYKPSSVLGQYNGLSALAGQLDELMEKIVAMALK